MKLFLRLKHSTSRIFQKRSQHGLANHDCTYSQTSRALVTIRRKCRLLPMQFHEFFIFLEKILLKITLFLKNDYKIGNTSSYQLPLTFISNHLAGNRVIFNKILFKNKKFVKLTRSKSALSSNCPQSSRCLT